MDAPEMLLTATCGAAKYGRLTTDAKVVSAFKLIDWTITTERRVGLPKVLQGGQGCPGQEI
eukprot:scaffold108040_cov122-Cyclotella_meneghiniana.AAC.1